MPKTQRTREENKTLGVFYKQKCWKTTIIGHCNFNPILGKQWAIFIHPSWGMRTKLILLNIHPMIHILNAYIIFTKKKWPTF